MRGGEERDKNEIFLNSFVLLRINFFSCIENVAQKWLTLLLCNTETDKGGQFSVFVRNLREMI